MLLLIVAGTGLAIIGDVIKDNVITTLGKAFAVFGVFGGVFRIVSFVFGPGLIATIIALAVAVYSNYRLFEDIAALRAFFEKVIKNKRDFG